LRQKAQVAPTALPAAPSAPSYAPVADAAVMPDEGLTFVDDDYGAIGLPNYHAGKRYFEIWIDRGGIAQLGDMVLTPGFQTASVTVTRMINIRRAQTSAAPIALGFAIDLDNGFVYVRENGQWLAEPGSVNGLEIKLNRDYHALLEGSSDVKELGRRGLIKVNLGGHPFEYVLPDGYRPFKE
jgi:hypothetical protein